MEPIQSFFSGLWRDIQLLLSSLGEQERFLSLAVGTLDAVCRFLLPVLALLVVVRCARSLLQGRLESESWGWLTDPEGNYQVIHHWEVLLGRSRRCDIVLTDPTVSRNHAALIRDDKGEWVLHPLQSKNGVYLNGATELS